MKLIHAVVITGVVLTLAPSAHAEDQGFRYSFGKKVCMKAGKPGWNRGWIDERRRNGECANLVGKRVPDMWSGRLVGANMTRTELSSRHMQKVHLEGAILMAASVPRARFDNAILKNARLQGIRGMQVAFTKANLAGADLTAADIPGASFFQANLRNAALPSMKCSGCLFQKADMRNAILTQAVLHGANFSEANLTRARLDKIQANKGGASRVKFDKANMRAAALGFADIRNASFVDTDLRNANLHGAKMSGSYFIRTNFRGARMTNLVAQGGTFKSARFQGADLRNADLSRSILFDARFDNADLRGANLSSLHKESKHIYVKGAKFDARTKLPFSRKAARKKGMVFVK